MDQLLGWETGARNSFRFKGRLQPTLTNLRQRALAGSVEAAIATRAGEPPATRLPGSVEAE